MKTRLQQGFSYFLPLLGVAAVTAGYKLLITGVNATTMALSFLLVVLLTAASGGIGPAILASIGGMLCFNFFFLPPVGTFTIHDPQNWVALFAFLLTAIIASQLSSAARKRAREAEKSREEVWKLYQLSRAIIITPDPETAVSAVSRQVREAFEIASCKVFTPDKSGRLRMQAAASLAPELGISQELLQEAFEKGELRIDPAQCSTYAPLKVGVRVTGVLCLTSGTMATETIEAISGLVALALERARFLKELSRTEVLKQSDQLKSALLASVSHDLRTPLTSIRAAVDNLLEKNFDWNQSAVREFHLIISEEVKRLTKLVQNLLEMARIEAGELHPLKRWGSVSEIIGNAMDRCGSVLASQRVVLDLAADLPLVKVDSQLVAEVLTNLIDNAAKYSLAGSGILIGATIQDNQLAMVVTDHGPGIPSEELPRIFERFYRGRSPENRREGTGMGLAISRGIIEAHGGRIWAESVAGKGTSLRFTIPVEHKLATQPAGVLGEQE
jgi:two-component system, OmpR family, sensor histidine kinase KdpD